ncbi:uncharacterized protein [Trachinotus anak]|uniref:uncharacterized protein isoform X1 n=1 Tax=Trachinotus anak TaxID=443729 RepID=UPI0039F22D84
MKTFTLITALLLCSFSWISVSVSQSQTVEVQSGEEVTLRCSNITKSKSVAFWFRLVNRTEVSCISFMTASDSAAELCDGYKNEKFDMKSNMSSIFLKIKKVDSSDSGLYFCGFYTNGNAVFSVSYLNVEGQLKNQFDDEDSISEKKTDEKPELTILRSVTVLLVMIIIGLVVKIRKLQKAANEELHPERNKNLGSDDLNSAALRLLSKTIRNRRPASEREVETHVIYNAAR